MLFWLTFWPGATLAALATPAVWTSRREPAVKFLLAWLVPSWLVLELVPTKLPHYVLPLYPAIAILIAGAIDAHMLSRRPVLVWGTIWWFVVPMVAGLAGIVALAVIGRQFGLLVWLLMGGAAVMGFLAWRLYQTDGAEQSLLRAITAAVLTAIAIFALVVPSLGQLFPSVTLARILRDSGCASRPPRPSAIRSRVWSSSPARRPASPIPRVPRNSCAAANVDSLSSRHARNAVSPSAPKPSGCAIPPGPVWKRSISATDSRSRSRSTVRQIRRDHEPPSQPRASRTCVAARAMDTRAMPARYFAYFQRKPRFAAGAIWRQSLRLGVGTGDFCRDHRGDDDLRRRPRRHLGAARAGAADRDLRLRHRLRQVVLVPGADRTRAGRDCVCSPRRRFRACHSACLPPSRYGSAFCCWRSVSPACSSVSRSG